jgi:hypothetical protein
VKSNPAITCYEQVIAFLLCSRCGIEQAYALRSFGIRPVRRDPVEANDVLCGPAITADGRIVQAHKCPYDAAATVRLHRDDWFETPVPIRVNVRTASWEIGGIYNIEYA